MGGGLGSRGDDEGEAAMLWRQSMQMRGDVGIDSGRNWRTVFAIVWCFETATLLRESKSHDGMVWRKLGPLTVHETRLGSTCEAED
jgi:hypothetical protein